MLSNVYHVVAQLVLRLVNAGRIQEYDLTAIVRVYGLNPVSRRLRLIGCDRDLLPIR